MRYPVAALLMTAALARASASDFSGPSACVSCHADVARTQSTTNMALTWIRVAFPAHLFKKEGDTEIRVADRSYAVGADSLPIEAEVGGKRHGISFLARLSSLGGLPLARPALIETRFMQSAHSGDLVLSPGFPEQMPEGLDTSLGRALAPDFEQKCLNCHGQPSASTGSGGVHCESCHGPAAAHVQSKGAVHTARMDPIAQCEGCHGGFARLADPLPEDLLISNQANALRNSECYRNGTGLTCTTCHDPHADRPDVAARSNAACKSCHSLSTASHAAICPVNKTGSCTACHMREVKRGPFLLVDHWIRAERNGRPPDPALRSTLRPRRLFLRLIVTPDETKAKQALAELNAGQTFFDVAQRYSIDPSARGGGFLGDTQLDTMAAPLANAAAVLKSGEYSPVIANVGKFFVVQRIPADFREQANRKVQEATQLRMEHRLEDAAKQFQEALAIYPYFLRGLIFLAGTLGEQGDGQRAAAILQFASQLYPQDPAAPYNLGVTLRAMGRLKEEALAYRRAITLEPGMAGAYQNLGASLLAQNQLAAAEQTFRDGLQQDPLAVALYYNLSIVQEQQGKHTEAAASLALARKLNSAFVKAQETGAK